MFFLKISEPNPPHLLRRIAVPVLILAVLGNRLFAGHTKDVCHGVGHALDHVGGLVRAQSVGGIRHGVAGYADGLGIQAAFHDAVGHARQDGEHGTRDDNGGFDVTKYANDLKSMNYTQVKDWVEYQLISSDVNTDTICRNIKVNFFDLTDEDIEDMDSGTYIETVSFHQYCPILNNVFNGLPLGTTTMISAPSGRGKSTFTMSNLIYPIIRDGEKAIVISNELTYKQYQAMLLSIIAVREFGYYGLTREKINKSRLKDEDKEIRQKIQSFIRENKLNERLVFVDYESADISVVKKMMKKYSKLGFNVAFFDTFKASDSSDGKAWGKIIEDAKQLTFTAKETNQALVITYQVAPHAENKYSMSRADLAEGKSLITVITNHFIFRPIRNDEFSGQKHDLHCYKLKRNEITQKWEKVPFELKNDGNYYIVGTIDKTRFSGDSRSIVYKFLGTWGIYEELCYAIPSTDVDYRK